MKTKTGKKETKSMKRMMMKTMTLMLLCVIPPTPFSFRGGEKWQGDPVDEKDTTYKKRQYTKKQTKRNLT